MCYFIPKQRKDPLKITPNSHTAKADAKNGSVKNLVEKAFECHLRTVEKSFLFCLCCDLLWVAMQKFEIHFSEKSSDRILTGTFLVLIGIYAIPAGLILSKLLEELRTVTQARLKNDLKTFLLYRDERIPLLLHVLLGATGMMLILTIMLLRWEEMLAGLYSVTLTSFFIMQYGLTVYNLDDPRKSVWIRGQVPEKWYEASIELCREEGDVVTTPSNKNGDHRHHHLDETRV